MKRLRLKIKFPEGITEEEIREILRKIKFCEMKSDGSFRKNIYIKICLPVNFHCFCREENNKVSLFCHVDCRSRVNDEIRETWFFSSNGRINRDFIERFSKELTKVIKEVIRTNWEEIKEGIEKEIERKMKFKK